MRAGAARAAPAPCSPPAAPALPQARPLNSPAAVPRRPRCACAGHRASASAHGSGGREPPCATLKMAAGPRWGREGRRAAVKRRCRKRAVCGGRGREASGGGRWVLGERPQGSLRGIGGIYGRNQPRSAPKSGLGGSSGLLKCPGAPRGFAEPPAGRAGLWGGLWEGELGPCCCGNRVEGRTWRT